LFDRDEPFLNFLQNIKKKKSSYYRVAVKDDERRREKGEV
jgi:hypothetical protein